MQPEHNTEFQIEVLEKIIETCNTVNPDTSEEFIREKLKEVRSFARILTTSIKSVSQGNKHYKEYEKLTSVNMVEMIE